MAKTKNRREFLQLAHVYDPKKDSVAGWMVSEKLDGMRAYWDGGITRGMYTIDIPFANVAKDARYLTPPKSTGLWSRYGKPIQSPMWWLDKLPAYPLDGELYMGRGKFQTLVSTVKKLVPDDDMWRQVRYAAFDLPDYSQVFADGTINNPNFEKTISNVLEWLHMQKICKWDGPKIRRFESVSWLLNKHHPDDGKSTVYGLPQTALPYNQDEAKRIIDTMLDDVVSKGGEGLILRNHNSVWEPQRSHNCLKVKPYNDCEVTVKSFVWGRETDRGSKLMGLMGAMVVDFNGKRLELSGFTDAERKMISLSGETFDNKESIWNAGKPMSSNWVNEQFPIDSTITIKYRELTDDGLPKEARYWRKPG